VLKEARIGFFMDEFLAEKSREVLCFILLGQLKLKQGGSKGCFRTMKFPFLSYFSIELYMPSNF